MPAHCASREATNRIVMERSSRPLSAGIILIVERNMLTEGLKKRIGIDRPAALFAVECPRQSIAGQQKRIV
jgi:hypothetical protein